MFSCSLLQKPEAILSLEKRIFSLLTIAIMAFSAPIVLFMQFFELYEGRYDLPLAISLSAFLLLLFSFLFVRGFRARAIFIVVYFLLSGSISLLHYGPIPSCGLAFLTAALIAIIFLGFRAAMVVLVAMSASFFMCASLFILGLNSFFSPAVSDLSRVSTWLRVGIPSLAFIGCIFVLIDLLLRGLKSSAVAARRALEEMEKERGVRKSAELAFIEAQRHEIVSRAASSAAHDLNNLLSAIGGAADLATMSSLNGQNSVDELRIIKEGVYRASALTRQLLSFGKQLAPNRKRADLPSVLNGVIDKAALTVKEGFLPRPSR